MPEQVEYSLNKATGKVKDTETGRKNAYDTVQNDPKSRINRWVELLNHTLVHRADRSPDCKQFYNTFSNHYKPLIEMKLNKTI